jgi:hypothetical protein
MAHATLRTLYMVSVADPRALCRPGAAEKLESPAQKTVREELAKPPISICLLQLAAILSPSPDLADQEDLVGARLRGRMRSTQEALDPPPGCLTHMGNLDEGHLRPRVALSAAVLRDRGLPSGCQRRHR